MENMINTQYVVSVSLTEAYSGCMKIIPIKTAGSCTECQGKGIANNSKTCSQCDGTGQIYDIYPISVRIPAGVYEGYQINVKTKDLANTAKNIPDEITVITSIKSHKLFKRDKDDLIYDLPLNFAQSALGAEVYVPTLKKGITLHIPPGTQADTLFRIKGKGMPHIGKSGKGDQIVRIKIVTPTLLNDHQRLLLEQLAKSLPGAKLPGKKTK